MRSHSGKWVLVEFIKKTVVLMSWCAVVFVQHLVCFCLFVQTIHFFCSYYRYLCIYHIARRLWYARPILWYVIFYDLVASGCMAVIYFVAFCLLVILIFCFPSVFSEKRRYAFSGHLHRYWFTLCIHSLNIHFTVIKCSYFLSLIC